MVLINYLNLNSCFSKWVRNYVFDSNALNEIMKFGFF